MIWKNIYKQWYEKDKLKNKKKNSLKWQWVLKRVFKKECCQHYSYKKN